MSKFTIDGKTYETSVALAPVILDLPPDRRIGNVRAKRIAAVILYCTEENNTVKMVVQSYSLADKQLPPDTPNL